MKIEYSGQKFTFSAPIGRYLKKINRKLRFPKEIRAKVMSDLATEICSRAEIGETYEDILASMGSPADVAAGLNEEMSDLTYRKSKWRWAFLVVGLCSLLWLFFSGLLSLFSVPQAEDVGIIGGADGPTAIFITTSPHTDFLGVILAAAVLALSIFGFYKLGHLKK